MKTIAIAILTMFLIGMAGAVTIPTPTYNAGHSGGDKFPGPVQVNDLMVDDDAQIGDDAAILGDLAVTGAISSGVGTISSGVYDGDLRLAANHSFYSTAGSGGIDWSNGTGIFKTSTGAVTVGPGAVGITGILTIANLTAITAATGSSAFDLSASTGAFKTPSGTNTIDGATVFAANKGVTVAAGTSAFDFSGGTGVFKTSTGAVTIGPGATTVSGSLAYSVNASTTISSILTSSSTKTVYGIDAHAANVTLTLPDAATVTGRTYVIGTNYDPGSYYVKITATGSDKLGGTGGFTIAQTTDGKAGMTLTSDGTLYILGGAYGTWAEGTA